MANEFAQNIQDASLNPAPFALPSAASSAVYSATLDLGADAYKPNNFPELDISIPALSATIAPDTKTVTVSVELSGDSGFASVSRTILYDVLAGADGAGIGAYAARIRFPSDAPQYARVKVAFGAGTTTGAALSATVTLRH